MNSEISLFIIAYEISLEKRFFNKKKKNINLKKKNINENVKPKYNTGNFTFYPF